MLTRTWLSRPRPGPRTDIWSTNYQGARPRTTSLLYLSLKINFKSIFTRTGLKNIMRVCTL